MLEETRRIARRNIDGTVLMTTERVLNSLVNITNALSAVQPKKGKWIDKGITGDWQYQTDGRGSCWHEWQCDQCKEMVKQRSFYCPNCGARMEVTE